MELKLSRISVRSLDGGEERFGILAEGSDGRALIALAAATADELQLQLEDAGGPAAYLRRFGAIPLDPEGIAASPDGAGWVAPDLAAPASAPAEED